MSLKTRIRTMIVAARASAPMDDAAGEAAAAIRGKSRLRMLAKEDLRCASGADNDDYRNSNKPA